MSESVTMIPAGPGFDVLEYHGDTWESVPVVAWAVHTDEEEYAHVAPVTYDAVISFDDPRPVCAPDGSVRLAGISYFPTIAHWFAAMQKDDRSLTAKPKALPAPAAAPAIDESGPVVSLDKFRKSFTKGD